MADSITAMKPYYDHNGITIYHGDCRDVLPGLDPVDLVLTDPPYGIGEAAGKNKRRGLKKTIIHHGEDGRTGTIKPTKATDYGVSLWDDSPIDDDLMDIIIKAGRYAVIFGGNYYSLPPSSCWLVWDKENGKTDFADAELAWTNYGTAVRLIRHLWNGMFRKGKEKRFHPTQKPLVVMKWAIEKCPIEPKTILDPFMGSGTTLRAAKDIGISAIGIDQEEKYCEIAAKRLSQEVLLF